MPYAISTLLRYVILSVGFSVAIVQLGYGDPTKLTILVSAFGVGLGFGMQNIVNNFVSGLILLFERPVQVGDVIELDNITGVDDLERRDRQRHRSARLDQPLRRLAAGPQRSGCRHQRGTVEGRRRPEIAAGAPATAPVLAKPARAP